MYKSILIWPKSKKRGFFYAISAGLIIWRAPKKWAVFV